MLQPLLRHADAMIGFRAWLWMECTVLEILSVHSAAASGTGRMVILRLFGLSDSDEAPDDCRSMAASDV